MSHSMRESATRGEFRSHLTGRVYPYVRERSGAAKREALAKLKAEDAQVRDVNNQRAAPIIGRELSEAEHRKGNWQPDNRSTREKIEQEAVHIEQPKHDPNRNHFAERVAQLEGQLSWASTLADKSRIKRRLEIAKQEAAEFDRKLAERKAWEAHMNSSAVQDAIVYGQAWLARLETNPSVPQDWVNAAKARLEQLKLTGNAEEFWQANDAFEAERKATLEQRTLALDAEATKVKAEAAELRREAAESVTE